MKKNFFNKAFLLFLLIGLFTRFYNLSNRLYFVWDNGRDAVAMSKIVRGDLTLIGHTSGIEGFFLGPAWFYLGSIGYLLGASNPWVIAYWYIAVTAISIPLFWLLSKRLFKDKKWQWLCAYLLLLTPASIKWSSFVWNPMITIPLMTGSYLALLKARKSRKFLALAFFLLALTLQFEFAYAIFFVASLFLLIPWIRQKIDFRDFLYVGTAIGVTLIPQILFELKHNFIMSKALLKSFSDNSKSIAWTQLCAQRPMQLFNITQKQLFGSNSFAKTIMLICILTICFASYVVLKNKLKKQEKYIWQLAFTFFIIPYVFFMLWRGNNGYFFDYYLTPHFVFIIPVLLLSFQKVIKKYKFSKIFFILFILGISFASLTFIKNKVLYVKNNAGLKVMSKAVKQIFAWQRQDNIRQATVRIFTPNTQTEHYDYLLSYQAKQLQQPMPLTTFSGNENIWYILIEPDRELSAEYRFNPWYKSATASGELIRERQIGDLKLETWKNSSQKQ